MYATFLIPSTILINWLFWWIDSWIDRLFWVSRSQRTNHSWAAVVPRWSCPACTWRPVWRTWASCSWWRTRRCRASSSWYSSTTCWRPARCRTCSPTTRSRTSSPALGTRWVYCSEWHESRQLDFDHQLWSPPPSTKRPKSVATWSVLFICYKIPTVKGNNLLFVFVINPQLPTSVPLAWVRIHKFP